jgi:hypothetical protein
MYFQTSKDLHNDLVQDKLLNIFIHTSTYLNSKVWSAIITYRTEAGS